MTRTDWLRPMRGADRYAVPVGLICLTWAIVAVHIKQYPHIDGWFSWADQGRYLTAARAWAHGQLDPALHHYPPGYSLMAAPFVWLLPAQPFAVPDLVCLWATLIIFAKLAKRLAPDRPGWRAASVLAFCLAVIGCPSMRRIWSVPWNTTGAAPFELGAMLAVFRLIEAPGIERGAIIGLVLGCLAGIRPSDAAILAPCCAVFALIGMRGLARQRILLIAGAGCTGLLVGCLPFALAHFATHGGSGGHYVSKSFNIGFDWRLLPLRWVTLVLDPRPLLPEGMGLAEALPWIVPGFGGLLFLVAGHGRDSAAWRFIAVSILLHWMLYLSYRDLQPYGLWRFNNVHYFKWTFPFLVLAGFRLIAAFASATSRRRALIASACSLAFLLWQPIGVETGRTPVLPGQSGSVPLAGDLSSVHDAVFLPLRGGWRDIYFGPPTLSARGVTYDHTSDFKLQPLPGGALLQPLRPLPPGPLVFRAGPETQLIEGADIVSVREVIEFGIPCGILPHRAACRTPRYDGDENGVSGKDRAEP